MKVKILRTTVANKQVVEVGQIVEVSEQEGSYLVVLGKAAHVAEAPAEKKTVEVETADAVQPNIETTAALPKVHKRKSK